MLLTQVIFKKCQVNKQYTYNGDNLLKWLWISLCFFFFSWWKIAVVTSLHLTLCVKKLFQWFVCLVHAFECSFTYPACLLFSEYLSFVALPKGDTSELYIFAVAFYTVGLGNSILLFQLLLFVALSVILWAMHDLNSTNIMRNRS